MIKKTLPYLRNKYLITFLGMFFWLLFFDKNDLLSQLNLMKKLRLLEDEKKYYLQEIIKSKTAMVELATNEKNLEKFARERYLMKKENEDIFVIINEKGETLP